MEHFEQQHLQKSETLGAAFLNRAHAIVDAIDVDEKDAEFKIEVHRLVEAALNDIEQKYGVNGEGAKPFHDVSHTVELMGDSVKALALLKDVYGAPTIGGKEMLLVAIAAAYHDIIQEDPRTNEEKSALEATKRMKQSSIFSDDDREAVSQIIKATVFDPAEHRQEINPTWATQIEALDVLEWSISLADLMALGDNERQHWRGNRLFWELPTGKAYTNAPDLAQKVVCVQSWFNGQVKFLTNQKSYLKQYYPEIISARLFPDLDKNIELYTNLLRYLDEKQTRGELTEKVLDLIMSKNETDSREVKEKLKSKN